MQIKLFTIPVGDNGDGEAELNKFLRGNKVLEVVHEFNKSTTGACWHFCVKYIQSSTKNTVVQKKQKIDYKEILNEEEFAVFSKLRECRKQVAKEDLIPAFAIFTDEQMAAIAKLPEINIKSMQTVNGIGAKTAEKYGERILKILRDGN